MNVGPIGKILISRVTYSYVGERVNTLTSLLMPLPYRPLIDIISFATVVIVATEVFLFIIAACKAYSHVERSIIPRCVMVQKKQHVAY